MKKEVNLEFTGEIHFTYDPESPEFKRALQDYQDVIYKDGKEKDMLNHVANSIMFRGLSRMIEGVGYAALIGTHASFLPDNFCGIYVADGYDDLEYQHSIQ